MSYTPVLYAGDGSTRNFTIPFPYMAEEEVVVTVNDAEAPYSFLSENIIQFDTAPAFGANIYIQRKTDDDERVVVWNSATTLTSQQLNQAVLQLFYLSQEAKAVVESTIFQNYTGNYTAGGNKIVDVADPTEDTDAATKGYVDAADAALMVDVAKAVDNASNYRDQAAASASAASIHASASAASKSSAQTYASIAQAAANSITGNYFETVAEAEAATIPSGILRLYVKDGAYVYEYLYDEAGTDLTTADSKTWTLLHIPSSIIDNDVDFLSTYTTARDS